MRRAIATLTLIVLCAAVACAAGIPGVLPRPAHLATLQCHSDLAPNSIGIGADPGGVELLDRRLAHLGLPALRRSAIPAIRIAHAALPPQSYRLTVRDGRASILSGDSSGSFYALVTLAQLVRRVGGRAVVPCVAISDAPALRWRILSDDISRGPLPTMRYFRRRIRTIAAFKMNGYSPYMEHVFISPSDPLPAPLDGITPTQLGALARYAARFHVAFIPEQQTFAHMHNTLKYERYAAMAELPHGFLLSPANPAGLAYAQRLIGEELAVVPHPPFFHIGSDETATLGDGTSAALVRSQGKARVYADHVVALNRTIAPSGARTMLWDDGVEADPAIAPLLPRDVVLVNWHYGKDRSFQKYIDLIAKDGFAQMV
ncbi:MAG TPA: glycoside hydrolase family 20 zincin-like fold domain-containing protein, partial [Candidatus Dormibacteraeota bacterium]|nr:glycoside hydrolase family 20 zincin-like fold domain-containing protein [Candidatus Dormibacteraeota bacterium]